MSDYLSDEEQVARLRSWWSENSTFILLAAILTIAVVVGWRWYQSNRAATIEASSTVYADFLEADDDLKPALAAELAAVGGGTAYPLMAQLTLANLALEQGAVGEAKAALEAALAASNDSDMSDLVNLRLARIEQQLGSSEAALKALSAVRGPGLRSLVAELKGDIHIANDERALAHEAYKAAFEEVSEGERRPVLELKMNTTAGSVSKAVTPDTEIDVDATQAPAANDSGAQAAADND